MRLSQCGKGVGNESEETHRIDPSGHAVYFTFGRYDGVVIFEAPDTKTAMSFVMETGFATDYTVETLAAVPAKEV